MSGVWAVVWLDAVAQARRPRPFVVRVLAASAVLVGLYVTYAAWFGASNMLARPFDPPASLTVHDLAAFAERFAATVLVVQYVAVVVLTPALVADCIARDRERGTLDLVLTTQLSAVEFVAGRLASRLIGPLSAALALVPVLMLSRLFGGVSLERFALAAIILTSTTFVLGCISAAVSGNCKTVQGAMVGAILACTLFGGFFGVMTWAVVAQDNSVPITLGVVFPVMQIAFGVACFTGAVESLRRPSFAPKPERFRPEWVRDVTGQSGISNELLLRYSLPPDEPAERPAANVKPLPPLGDDNPIRWKDRYFHAPLRGRHLSWGLVIATGGLMFMTWGLLGVAVAAVVVFVQALGAVARERECGTLDALLLTPVSGDAILLAKYRAAVTAAPWPLVAPTACLLTLFLIERPAVAVAGAGVLVADFMCFATVGLTISTFAPTTRRAYAVGGGVILATLVGPGILVQAVDAVNVPWLAAHRDALPIALSPLFAWAAVLERSGARSVPGDPWGIVLHVAFGALVLLVLPPVCRWRLRREGGG